MKKRIFAALLVLLLLLCACGAEKPWQAAYRRTGQALAAQEDYGVGSIGGEWAVIGLSRSGLLKHKIYCYQAVDRYRSGDLSVDGKTEGMRDMALTAYQREMEAEISEGVYHRIFLFADGIVILCACVCAWSTYRTKKELLESA